MRSTILVPAAVILAAGVSFCQSDNAKPVFDVASVRPSANSRSFEGFRRQNVQTTPDSVTIRSASLKSCIAWAWHVYDYQVTGPAWIEQERYDIAAKASGPTTEDQLRLMTRALLAERLKVEVHNQTKELQSFVLSIGKNGPKFKESSTDGEADIQPDQKRMSVAVQRASISQLVDLLSNAFKMPVVDMTGLKGKYDITINVAKYATEFQPSPGGAPPDPIQMVTMGLQEELGLKLESKKMSLDLVIVDRAEKVPAEN